MATNKDLLQAIDLVRFNPSEIQRKVISLVESSEAGEFELSDPTNPFIHLMEMSSVLSSAAMVENNVLNRKQYATAAVTEEDLYRHMSDVDYVGRFANPARTHFDIIMGLEEVYAKAVATGVANVRKLVIPRHSVFSVAGFDFTMQYPIEIRIMAHGGLQVVYDVEKVSPLQVLESNIVDWKVVTIREDKYLNITVPVGQFKISTQYGSLDASTGFSESYSFEDEFYSCRCFTTDRNGDWVEVLTTHSDQVYDPLRMTVALRVEGNTLKVSVPQVYFSSGLARNELRVDIYTTKGPLELILGNYEPNSFTAQWIDLEGDDDRVYSAPIETFNTILVYSTKNVTGGTKAMSFDELRERVLKNSYGTYNIPITRAQVPAWLEDRGYSVVSHIDNLTRRIFHATRSLPSPTNGTLSTGAGCSIGMIQATVEQMSQLPTVRDNLLYNRITLLPDTVYENVGGLITFVPKTRVDAIKAMPADLAANEVNNANFVYSPFHYVLDMNGNAFSSRAYYLDSPSVEARLFVEENDTVGLVVSTKAYKIERIPEGYKLTVSTGSSDEFKALPNVQVHAQLSIRPEGESERAYINGTLIGRTESNERVYEFVIGTNYDLVDNHNLILTSFKMFDELTQRRNEVKLTCDFDIVYAVSDYEPSGVLSSEIDNNIARFMLPNVVYGVSRERLRIRLGYSLEGLWTNSRSVITAQDYQRYTANVPWLYEENVYARDPQTGTIQMTYNEATQEIAYTVLHHKGDPVLDEDDNPMYRYRIGDVKIDELTGQPIPANQRKLLRQVDVFLIDGAYRFATEGSAVDYRESLSKMIVNWIAGDIKELSAKLLEMTSIYFYPKKTLGNIDVLVRDGVETSINSSQSFFVKFYMSKDGYSKDELRSSLIKTARETIAEVLKGATVSISQIIYRLKGKVGDDVMAVEVSGLGGDNNLQALTVRDDSARCNIRKRLLPLPDGTLAVQEDVTVDFIRHQAD